MADYSVVHLVTHDETKPAGNRARSLGDDDIREHKEDVRERFAVDHEGQADESGYSDIGIHKQVTYKTRADDPTAYDNVGCTYVKTVSGVRELFWMDSSGNVVQLTSGGIISDTVNAKSGDLLLSSVTTARAGWTEVSSSYEGKFLRISDTNNGFDTGGADTHTHAAGTYAGPSHTHTSAAHTHAVSGTSGQPNDTGDGFEWNVGSGVNTRDHTHTLNFSSGGAAPTTDAGGTGAITGTSASGDNVPAYINCKMFQKD